MPGSRNSAAGARQPRHHRADRRARSTVGDVAIRQVVDLAQHDHLAEWRRAASPISRRIDCPIARGAGHRCLRRVGASLPHRRRRRLAGVRCDRPSRSCRRRSAWQTLRRMANSQGLIAPAAKRIEMAERAQIAFLHGVVGVGGVAAADSARAYRPRRDAAARASRKRRALLRIAASAPPAIIALPRPSCRNLAGAGKHHCERRPRRSSPRPRWFRSCADARSKSSAYVARCRECERELVVGVDRLRLERRGPRRRPCAGCRRG